MGTEVVRPSGSSSGCFGSCSCPRGNQAAAETVVAFHPGMVHQSSDVVPDRRVAFPFRAVAAEENVAVAHRKIHRTNRRNV